MVIVEYSNEWSLNFIKIKEELQKNLPSFVRIEHVGSTAIKGMCAKPIIDVAIVVKDDNNFIEIKNDLEVKFGYFHIEENDFLSTIGRQVFKRRNSLNKMCSYEQSFLEKNIFKHNGNVHSEILDTIKHNLYVCKEDAGVLKGYTLFRDYLNCNFEEMQKYYNLKKEIIEKYGNEDYDTYVKVKNDEYSHFFMDILNKALNNE